MPQAGRPFRDASRVSARDDSAEEAGSGRAGRRRDRPRRGRRGSRSAAKGDRGARQGGAHAGDEPLRVRARPRAVSRGRSRRGCTSASASGSTRSPRSFRSSAPRKASRTWRSRTSSPGASRSFPSRATTRIRAERCSRAASRIATRCGRARIFSSTSTRFRETTLERTRILYLNYPNNPTAAIAPRGLSRARRRSVPRARHSARLRQRVLRARVRRLRAAEHLRDRRSARRRDRVSLALEDVQHDGLALRLGRRVARDRVGADQGEVVHRHRTVHGGAGRRRRGARELRRVRARQRGDVQGATRRRGRPPFAPPDSRATFRARRCISGSRCPRAMPSALFAERLLEEEGVVVMPGSGFGAGGEGFFRISFITSPERIAEAAKRAGRVLASMAVEVVMKARLLDEPTETTELDRDLDRGSRRGHRTHRLDHLPVSALGVLRPRQGPNADRAGSVREGRAAAASRTSAMARTKRRSRARRSTRRRSFRQRRFPRRCPRYRRPTVEHGRDFRNRHGERRSAHGRRDRRRASASRSAHRAAPEHAARAAVDGRSGTTAR